MPRWALQCDKCRFVFTHSMIKDARASDFFLPEKPAFPDGGSALECPNCGHKDKYQRHELVYRS
jgi:rubredoxin